MPITPYDDEHIREGYKALRKNDHVGALHHLANIRYVPPTISRPAKVEQPSRQTDWLLQQIASDTKLSPSSRAFFLAAYEYSYLEKINEYLKKQLTEATAKEKSIRAPYLVSRKEALSQQLEQVEARKSEILESLKQHT